MRVYCSGELVQCKIIGSRWVCQGCGKWLWIYRP